MLMEDGNLWLSSFSAGDIPGRQTPTCEVANLLLDGVLKLLVPGPDCSLLAADGEIWSAAASSDRLVN